MSEIPRDNPGPSKSDKKGKKKRRGSSKGEKAQNIDAVASVDATASNGDGAVELPSTSQVDNVQLMHDTQQSTKDTQKSKSCTTKKLIGDSPQKVTRTDSDDLLNSQASKKEQPIIKNTIKKKSLKSTKTGESSEPESSGIIASGNLKPMGSSTNVKSDEKCKNAQDANVGESECGSKQSVSQDTSKNKKKGASSASNSKLSETKLLKRLEINKYTNFMKDFDPERSQREARKLENLPFPEKKEKKKQRNDNRLYDERGIFIETGEDLCDCLINDCPGCHFPCYRCRSCKCGHACRRNRTWCYDEIEIEGTGEIIRRQK